MQTTAAELLKQGIIKFNYEHQCLLVVDKEYIITFKKRRVAAWEKHADGLTDIFSEHWFSVGTFDWNEPIEVEIFKRLNSLPEGD